MSQEQLQVNLWNMAIGIQACLEKRAITSALVLTYSAIDTTGWLDSTEQYSTGTSFIAWTERYLLPTKPFKCTSKELWAARCGLLHTHSPESKLTDKKEARQLCYSWGSADASLLEAVVAHEGNEDKYVAVNVHDLCDGWRIGLRHFFEELDADAGRKSRVEAKAAKFFVSIASEPNS